MTKTLRDGPSKTAASAASIAAGKPVADAKQVLPAINRRALLTGVGLAATAVSAAAVVSPAMAFNATPAENAQRYKESEHVKTFYRVAGR